MVDTDHGSLIAAQRSYFFASNTRLIGWRREQLNAIRTTIDESRAAMYEAVGHDLRPNQIDTELVDVDFTIRETDDPLKHLHEWLAIEHVPTPVVMQPAHVRSRGWRCSGPAS